MRRQIIGTWQCADSYELTLLVDGRSVLKFSRLEGEGTVDGTWKVKDNSLILRTTHNYFSYRRGATNIFPVRGTLNPEPHRIFLLDAVHLAVVNDEQLDQ